MRIRRLVTLVFLGLLASAAQADAPPVGTWVALRVVQCQDRTFEAPRASPAYTPGERHRTAAVTGEVVESGWQDHDRASPWAARWVREHQASLPAPGASMTVVLPQWDAEWCRAALGQVRRFDYAYSCDTLPRRGPCLPPHQLVSPAEPR